MAYKTGNGTAIHFLKKSINQGLYQDSFRCWNDFIFISVSFNKGVKSNTWLTVENKNNILDNLSILFYRILDLEVQCCRFRKGCDLQPDRAHWQPHAALHLSDPHYERGAYFTLKGSFGDYIKQHYANHLAGPQHHLIQTLVSNPDYPASRWKCFPS